MRPLEGIKVIDFTQEYSGPFCTMQLADFGADVIKIENVECGDQSRTWMPIKDGFSGFYASINRGKRSLTLNLASEEGKEIIKKLVTDADVVVESFKVGTMENLGLGYENLKAINPGLIYATVSGFGIDGPLMDCVCHDNIAQSMSGTMEMTGFPKGEPTKIGINFADNFTGLNLCLGILMAYYNKNKTGVGQRLDVAKLDSLFALNEAPIIFNTMLNEKCSRAGNNDVTIAPYDVFEAQDGYISIGVASESAWPKMCNAIGMPELIEDPRFVDNNGRTSNYDIELRPIVEEYTKKNTKKDIEDILASAGVPCAPVMSVEEIMAHPQLKVRDMVVELEDPELGKFKTAGIPMKLEKTPGAILKPAPKLGQDSNEILKSLGYSEEEINRFHEKGIV
ncbi:MAG: CoA transferase [Maledivibacter sp.]|jgi:CoA:oxalate CoA-transferase|nr:CoA transferase [Maledivibacter sp.]